MIEIVNLTKSFITAGMRRYVFRDMNFVIPEGRNVAVLGRNGAGKSTLIRLLSGQDMPDSGKIVTSKSISFPVGLSGGFQGSLTGRQNVKFVARVHGCSPDRMREIVGSVEEFAELGEYFDLPVNSYSSGMRGRLAFGLSIAFDFDYYLIDEALSVGDARFKKKAAHALQERVDKSNVILVTHGMGQVRQMCDMVLILNKGGEVESFDSVEDGIKAYSQI
ncbi:polysaccharide ABC transporter ATP-binding protein [Bordetella trematum]|uniref:ABC transporter ATP-binding protein n=1 Tax=Bordetella trematum TaxID=123899 RepID=UPI00079B8AF1|nr:ABC transporter ATP-binding protein [Bordetella trematum]SAI28655.1 polysaccharide ABC transporter ATP-binding protein [Bordetella trematum]